MSARFLGAFPAAIATLVVGATVGAAIGALLGALAWSLASSGFSPTAVATSAAAGAVAGLVTATGTALLGERTRSALEWPTISAAGTALALVIVASTTRVAYLGLFVGVAATTSRIIALASRRLLAARLPTGLITGSVLAGYFVALEVALALAIILFTTVIYFANARLLRPSLTR